MGGRTEARSAMLIPVAILCAMVVALPVNTCHATGPSSGEGPSSTGCGTDAEDGHHRTGHSERLECYAQSSNDCQYSGGYVGGGTRFHGCGRFAQEGTWGRDYCGWRLSHRPWLNWSHGRRSQGGSGAYKTDGPKLVGH